MAPLSRFHKSLRQLRSIAAPPLSVYPMRGIHCDELI